MKNILTLILLFGYSAYGQNQIGCKFKVMASKEKKSFFTGKIVHTKIHSLKIPDIKNSEIQVDMDSQSTTNKKHNAFHLEFTTLEEELRIRLIAKGSDAYNTLAYISFDSFIAIVASKETITYKLFMPLDLSNGAGKRIFIYGLEVGPCSQF